jgi:hypothetical protein
MVMKGIMPKIAYGLPLKSLFPIFINAIIPRIIATNALIDNKSKVGESKSVGNTRKISGYRNIRIISNMDNAPKAALHTASLEIFFSAIECSLAIII